MKAAPIETGTDELLCELNSRVATITLNRPKAKNAVNLAVAKGIAAAIDELDSNKDIRVGIITGSGATFCAGMDLKAFITGELPMLEGRGFAGLVEALPKKPMIAAVEGFALAGGLEIALSCDLIVAADNSQFGIPEVKRGLVAAAGGLMRLPHQMPPRLAMELALTGDPMSAQRAVELGLINKVVAPGAVLEAAREYARTIVANGPLAVTVSKQIMLDSQDWSQQEMFAKQMEIALPVFTSKDATEGSVAFAEKRAPNWSGE